jgi:tetratricopeptide (TPR) repeat protein
MGCVGSASAATDEERATARSLANQGIAAFKAKRFGEAADLFQRAESLVHSPVHLLYLGRSYASIGKLVRAQEAFLRATREELPPNSPAAFAKAVDEAGIELDAIKPSLAQLTITVTGVDADHPAEVSVDGETIPAVMVGVPVPMDPGQHRVEAKAVGYLPAWRKISLAEGQSERLSLDLAPDPNAPPESEDPKDGTEVEGAGADETPTRRKKKSKSGEGNPVYLYTSLGALAVGLGGVTWGTYHLAVAFDAKRKANDRFNTCPPSPTEPTKRVCTPEVSKEVDALDTRDEESRTNSIVPYIVGGVGLILGTTLLVLFANSSAPESDAELEPGLRVQPWLGFQSVGVSGTF